MTSKANSSPRTDSQLMQFSTTNISPGLLTNFSSIICLFQAIFNSTTASIPTTHKDKDLVVGGLNTCPTNPASYLHWKIEKKNILSAVAWPISMKFGTLIQVFRLVVNLQKEHRGKILELTSAQETVYVPWTWAAMNRRLTLFVQIQKVVTKKRKRCNGE